MEPFKVAIVGGSVAGLAVALHLEKLGIDFIVLEAYDEIAPQVGASIGLAPNGLKICQQLGTYEDVKRISVAVADLAVRNAKGDTLWGHRILEPIREAHGYDLLFTERQKFLKVFQSKIKDQSKLLTNQRVVKIEDVGDGVKLHTKQGQVFEADIVVGADGVHSPVRSEMWRLAQEAGSNVFGESPGADVPTDYGCVFGISDATGDIKGGDDIQVHMKDKMIGLVADDSDTLYWFVFFKLPKTHYGLDFPKYSKEEEVAMLEVEADCPVTGTTTFGQVYKNVRVSQMTALPHHCFGRWHFGRVMTIGDACHKMSPIAGQGGCITLEACAALVDQLHASLQANGGRLSKEDIDGVFTRTTTICKKRASWIVQFSEMFQELSCWANKAYVLADLYIAPLAPTSLVVNQMFKACEGSYVSKTLPQPRTPKAPEPSILTPEVKMNGSWFSGWFGAAAKA